MTLSRRQLIALGIGAAVALPLGVGHPALALADARVFVDQLGAQAVEALTGPEISEQEREERFRTLLNEFFDMPGIGRFVLARYWKSATEEERAEFLGLFETLIVQAYARRFTEYSGERFLVSEVVQEGRPGYTTVRSVVQRPTGEDIRVDWLVLDKDGGQKIEDVKIEGVSMAQTYRSEFASVIQGGGGKVAALLAALRKKTGDPGAQNAAQ